MVWDDVSRQALGVIAIGRNEGDRLKACLNSVVGYSAPVVYVDSGSVDGSVQLARALGIEVVELDTSVPFTAARARNVGFARLRDLAPELRFVQFVDGDCEIANGWIEAGVEFLKANPDFAVVCGRRRERYPENSVYNLLCDIEWNTPVGEAKSCGGDAMMRADAFAAAGGFRASLIAGEEPELCVRLRAAGWRVWRLRSEMSLHDAAMSRFSQWWKRTMRTGYSFAEGAFLHGAPPERHRVRESRSAWMWGVALPVIALAGTVAIGPAGALVLGLYPIQVLRLALFGARSVRGNWWRSVFLVIGKFPEALGQLKFVKHRFFGGRSNLIEYK